MEILAAGGIGEEDDFAGAGSPGAAAVDLLFLPGSPPRYGTFAPYIPAGEPSDGPAPASLLPAGPDSRYFEGRSRSCIAPLGRSGGERYPPTTSPWPTP